MKYDVKLCELVRTAEIAADTYDFTVRAPELAAAARPGQFAHIYVPGRTLRRPISICDIDRENGTLRFVFQIRGAGTADLAKFKAGDSLDILAPLGNGFSIEPGKKALFVGGGIMSDLSPHECMERLFADTFCILAVYANEEQTLKRFV